MKHVMINNNQTIILKREGLKSSINIFFQHTGICWSQYLHNYWIDYHKIHALQRMTSTNFDLQVFPLNNEWIAI